MSLKYHSVTIYPPIVLDNPTFCVRNDDPDKRLLHVFIGTREYCTLAYGEHIDIPAADLAKKGRNHP